MSLNNNIINDLTTSDVYCEVQLLENEEDELVFDIPSMNEKVSEVEVELEKKKKKKERERVENKQRNEDVSRVANPKSSLTLNPNRNGYVKTGRRP